MGIIFDLDQTLIDSSIAKVYRDGELWKKAIELIPRFKLYPDILDTLEYLISRNIHFCIVTTSPKVYTYEVLKYWRIPFESIVTCEDTAVTKPDPSPIIIGIKKLKEQPQNVFAFGDRDIDIIASRSASVKTVACLWGAKEIKQLINSSPDFILKHSNELKPFILKNLTAKK